MRILLALIVALGVVAVLTVVGCSENVYVVREGPAPPPGYVIVHEGPPALIVERRPPPPQPGHIWIDGYWHWTGHKYNWERGHWVRPPREQMIWIGPRYERFEREWRYHPGHWDEGRGEHRR
jgi:hypothetical protein